MPVKSRDHDDAMNEKMLPDPSSIDARSPVDILFSIIKKKMLDLNQWMKKYKETWHKDFEIDADSDEILVYDGTVARVHNNDVYIGHKRSSRAEFPRFVFDEKMVDRDMQITMPVSGEIVPCIDIKKDKIMQIVSYYIFKNEHGNLFITNPWDELDVDRNGKKWQRLRQVDGYIKKLLEKEYSGFKIVKERTESEMAILDFLDVKPEEALPCIDDDDQARKKMIEKLINDCMIQACMEAMNFSLSEESLLKIIDEIDKIYDEIIDTFEFQRNKMKEYKEMLDEENPLDDLGK